MFKMVTKLLRVIVSLVVIFGFLLLIIPAIGITIGVLKSLIQ
jgi:hypothetical protein